MPVHNRALYLNQAVNSVVSQTYRHIELIIVDDGSTDDTPDALSGFTDVATVLRRPHRGQAAARNHGLKVARGDYIAYLDSDDYYAATKTERMVEALQATGKAALALCCTTEVFTDAATGVRRPNVDTGEDVWFATAVHPREFIDVIGGFDETLPVLEGIDLWFRMRDLYPTIVVEEPLYYHRHHDSNTTVVREHLLDDARNHVISKRAQRAVALGARRDPQTWESLAATLSPGRPRRTPDGRS